MSVCTCEREAQKVKVLDILNLAVREQSGLERKARNPYSDLKEKQETLGVKLKEKLR